ncbi:methyltransferase domain-containing protein [Planctomycetota bacterium]
MKNILFRLYMLIVRRLRILFTPSLKQSKLSEEHLKQIKPYIPLLDPEDFRGTSVLDLGCGEGQLSFQALAWKAREVCGVEKDKDKFKKAAETSETLKTGMRSMFICDDASRFSFWNMIGSFYVTLCLPLFPSEPRLKRCALLAKSAAHTNIMYICGSQGDTVYDHLEDILSFTDFTSIEYKGEAGGKEDTSGPLFRLSRSVLTQKKAAALIYSWIQNSTFSKIAVVGKAASGKSLIRKKLEGMTHNDHDYEIIDDCNDRDHLNSIKKMVLFDYRALEYVDDFEAVIFISCHKII